MTFGEKFKAERLRKRMTQQQVADALNINLRMITRYEKGESFPRTRESYRRIAELFDCNINYFLAEDDDFSVSDKGKYSEDSRQEAQQLISSMSGLFAGGDLTESDKDAVMQALEKIYWESRRRYHRKAASESQNPDNGED
ncbi:MAG: helix-turn-helix domain-containing protein [Clostridiales bacterium]|nr:helix-turn-helix domain-containing protein [Clostridiales bacterium]